MSNLKSINNILLKYYNISFDLNGLEETVADILSVSDSDSDSLFELIKACHSWELYLKSCSAIAEYYMGFFENKNDVIKATCDEAKKDIKNGSKNSIPFAKKCKITEEEPEKIKEAAEWILKCNQEDLKIFKKFIAEMNSYSRFFKANSFSCFRKYNRIRNAVAIF